MFQLDKITIFENYENLSVGFFESKIIEFEKDIEYSIEIKGLEGLNYINDKEDYNKKSKIEISSSNQKTILACLIIDFNGQ